MSVLVYVNGWRAFWEGSKFNIYSYSCFLLSFISFMYWLFSYGWYMCLLAGNSVLMILATLYSYNYI